MLYRWNSNEGHEGACHRGCLWISRDCHGSYEPAFVKAFSDLKSSPTFIFAEFFNIFSIPVKRSPMCSILGNNISHADTQITWQTRPKHLAASAHHYAHPLPGSSGRPALQSARKCSCHSDSLAVVMPVSRETRSRFLTRSIFVARPPAIYQGTSVVASYICFCRGLFRWWGGIASQVRAPKSPRAREPVGVLSWCIRILSCLDQLR